MSGLLASVATDVSATEIVDVLSCFVDVARLAGTLHLRPLAVLLFAGVGVDGDALTCAMTRVLCQVTRFKFAGNEHVLRFASKFICLYVTVLCLPLP